MLNEISLGLTLGSLQGLSYLLLTLFHMYKGKGPIIHFMGHHLPGYRRNIKGAIVSLVWGLIFGFISGFLIALIYNFFIVIFP
jgi:hypothetical protein